ncbi:MAG: trypsin-like peptidase domain-containing protein [Gemmatimonadota bacterium]|nr:MAG: trypsin-like peptidase domain-containing protein [Gemmatimonadota bacterium]
MFHETRAHLTFLAAVVLTVASCSDDGNTATAIALSGAFQTATLRAIPAVVSVSVEGQTPVSVHSLPIPEPFQKLFDLQKPEFELKPARGFSSGIILDRNGRIITNHHVVANASRVIVRLMDGREFGAEIIGSDPTTDLAVIRLQEEVEDLPIASFQDSDGVRVGDWVLALGNPLGLDFMVTAGIVSAKGHELTGRATALESYIQTDAAINQGNSGGPLIDLQGRVVGINLAIWPGPGFQGYGFAVPSNLALRVVEDLLEYGDVRRPYLGSSVNSFGAEDAEAFGLNAVLGAEVNTVDEESPAEKAGLEIGDVIIALDGTPIENATALTTALAGRQPGDTVDLTISRDGRRREVTAELGQFPRAQAAEQPAAGRPSALELLGFMVDSLTVGIARYYGYGLDHAVIVSHVERLSPAANAGIRPGQLVIKINNRPMEYISDFRSVARSIEPGEEVSVRVREPDRRETVINFRTRR